MSRSGCDHGPVFKNSSGCSPSRPAAKRGHVPAGGVSAREDAQDGGDNRLNVFLFGSVKAAVVRLEKIIRLRPLTECPEVAC